MSTTSKHEIKYDDIRTAGQAKVYRIIWKIPNFQEFLNDNKVQEFRTKINNDPTGDSPEHIFQLKMKFLGTSNDVMELYYLSRRTVFLKSFLYCDRRNNDARLIVEKDYRTVEANKWMYVVTITKHRIMNATAEYLDYPGCLNLTYKLVTAINIMAGSPRVPEATLSNDLENLLNAGSFSDVIIKSVDGVEYKVHKAVIASRSDVLKAHFAHNTKECNNNVVESPLNAEVLKEVLVFIYSDRVPKIDEIPEILLTAADFYQIKQMKRLCEESLHRKLTFENATEILQLADVHSANYLKEKTMDFIINGHEKLITKSDGWSKLEPAQLVRDLYEYVISNDNRQDIEFV